MSEQRSIAAEAIADLPIADATAGGTSDPNALANSSGRSEMATAESHLTSAVAWMGVSAAGAGDTCNGSAVLGFNGACVPSSSRRRKASAMYR